MGFGRAAVVASDVLGVVLVPDACDVPVAAELVRGLDRGRRFRFVATAGTAYCGTELKSKVDGIGSGSCFSVPYVTTITLWSASVMSPGSPVRCSPST
jgi:hypothetical protein